MDYGAFRFSGIAEETYERHNTFQRLLTGFGVDEKTAATSCSVWSVHFDSFCR